MLTVHHLNNSRSQRVLWLLEELGVPQLRRRHVHECHRMSPSRPRCSWTSAFAPFFREMPGSPRTCPRASAIRILHSAMSNAWQSVVQVHTRLERGRESFSADKIAKKKTPDPFVRPSTTDCRSPHRLSPRAASVSAWTDTSPPPGTRSAAPRARRGCERAARGASGAGVSARYAY